MKRIVGAVGPDVSVVALHGGSHAFAKALTTYPARSYRQKLVEYLTFYLGLFNSWMKWTSSSVHGSLNLLLMTKIIMKRLKLAETCDCMPSRLALRKAIIFNDLTVPPLKEVVAHIIVNWPLTASYLKKTQL